MKKLAMVFAMVLGFLGSIGVEAASAAFIHLNWRANGVSAVTNPQMYQATVFTSGIKVAGSLPPAKGGGIVIIDVTDRTKTQIGYLPADLSNDPLSGKRYGLRFTASTQWMKDQLYKRGFITATWNQIRGVIWDRELKRTLAGVESRYSDTDGRTEDDCKIYCDYEACVKTGMSMNTFCDCEEYQGRTFCRKKNVFIYSDNLDR